MREFVPLTALLRPLQAPSDEAAAPEVEIRGDLDRTTTFDAHAADEYAMTFGAIRRFRAALQELFRQEVAEDSPHETRPIAHSGKSAHLT